MSAVNLRVFIQARMSSSRFPGKMLAPLAGQPILAHVVKNAAVAVGLDRVVVLTSSDVSDDPLACYAEHFLGAAVFRGDLGNVLCRFQGALAEYPCEWFMRICGDSPLIDPNIMALMIQRIRMQDDLVTNVAVRTFPPGQSVEILKSSTFISIDAGALNLDNLEHVTSHYYANPERYVINTIRSVQPELAAQSMVIDTLEDLLSMEEKFMRPGEKIRDFGALMASA
jgi:spore coat polysaccharide biosynthesis protein SpsF (cytidylyltransferase family)